jgi:hypothetical protein
VVNDYLHADLLVDIAAPEDRRTPPTHAGCDENRCIVKLLKLQLASLGRKTYIARSF